MNEVRLSPSLRTRLISRHQLPRSWPEQTARNTKATLVQNASLNKYHPHVDTGRRLKAFATSVSGKGKKKVCVSNWQAMQLWDVYPQLLGSQRWKQSGVSLSGAWIKYQTYHLCVMRFWWRPWGLFITLPACVCVCPVPMYICHHVPIVTENDKRPH